MVSTHSIKLGRKGMLSVISTRDFEIAGPGKMSFRSAYPLEHHVAQGSGGPKSAHLSESLEDLAVFSDLGE